MRAAARIGAPLLVLTAAGLLAGGPARAATLPDGRGWEMVSPVEKNGGAVAARTAAIGEGVAQAAASGDSVAFVSAASFGAAVGAPPISQYVATRGGGGWSTVNLSPPLLSGTYSAASGDADPYLAFSADLSQAIVSGGWGCVEGGEECAAENPPLGPGGPPDYRNLYLREGSTYTPLITASNFWASLPPHPSEFHLAFEWASPDLRQVDFSTGSGLYEWDEGTISPTATVPAPPPLGVADGGARVFFDTTEALVVGDTNHDTDVYEREADGVGSCAKPAGCVFLISSGRSEDGARFAGASASGDDVFFTTDGSLVPTDPGSVDLYDARVGGGFPTLQTPIPCLGDACQPLPAAPEDPTPGTLLTRGEGNPPLRFPREGHGHRHGRGRHSHHRRRRRRAGRRGRR